METDIMAGVGRLDATTHRFIDMLAVQGAKPIHELSYSDARAVLEQLQAQPVHKAEARIEDRTIPVGPSGQVSIRIVRPAQATGTLPGVMYFHGGGWVLGSKDTHDRLIREIANDADAAVVFVNYTPSPEAHYPIPIEEAYAATRYVADHGADIDIDGGRLAIVGDSVGGNMATAVAIMAKQRGGPKIVWQVLMYPVTDAAMDTQSYQEFADGPWLTRKAMAWFWDAYAPDQSVRMQITASPLRATLDELSGLPPTLVITDENDVLRDEGEAYAHKLMTAGVQVGAVRCLGTVHDFAMLNPLSKTPATRTAIGLVCETLRSALMKGRMESEQEREKGHI